MSIMAMAGANNVPELQGGESEEVVGWGAVVGVRFQTGGCALLGFAGLRRVT